MEAESGGTEARLRRVRVLLGSTEVLWVENPVPEGQRNQLRSVGIAIDQAREQSHHDDAQVEDQTPVL